MTTAAPALVHASVDGFGVESGELTIGGVRLSTLAARAGQTPFYAYDAELMRRRVAQLRGAFPSAVRLHYAVKSNPLPGVVGLMRELVDGLDVASAGELQLALQAGVQPAHLSFAGPGKTDAELRAAVQAGLLLNVESLGEVQRLAAVSQSLGRPARVSVRINPAFELRGSGMRMGGGARPFGVDEEQVPGVLAFVASAGLAFEGFQVYAGSQCLQASAIVDAQRNSYELALRLADAAPGPVRLLNLGGGFGIPYFPGERRLDLAPIGTALHGLVERAAREMPLAALVVELGRYLVGEAGVYVARVLDRKVSRGQVFLVVDGGMHHHLAASGNLGQVLRRNYPVAIGTRMGEPKSERVSVVGPLCTPLDILADRVPLPAAEPGDLFVVFQSGAYGASASPQDFLGHPRCAELLVDPRGS